MRFFRDISIRIKVLIPSVILILALGIVSLLAIYGLDKQREALSTVNDVALDKMSLIEEFIVLSEHVQSDVFNISVSRFMNLPEKDSHPNLAHLEQGLSDLNVIYGQIITKWQLNQAERAILERMKKPMDAFRKQAQQAAVVVSDNPSFGVLLVRSSTVPFAKFRKTLAEFRNYQQEKIALAESVSNQRAKNFSTAIIVVTLLITLTGILTTVLISNRLISQPIRSITESMSQLADGELCIKIRGSERKDEIGAMARAVGVFRDDEIEKAQMEKVLRKSEIRYRELFDNMSSGVVVYEASDDGNDFIIKNMNKAGEQISKVRREEIIGKSVIEIFPGVKNFGLFDVFQQVWRTGEPKHHPAFFYEDARISHWVENYVYKLPSGEVVAVYDDVTERKEAEEQIKAALAEKEVLLKEIHHRVKNNLQALIYLIDMQVDRIQDPESVQTLTDLQGRIWTMSLVHENLYQAQDLARIDFGSYLEELTNNLLAVLRVSQDVSIQVDADEHFIDINLALACGLLVNELVTNALKYAFPENLDRNKEIRVVFRKKDREYMLQVSDNGIGLPPEFDWREADSLGLKLVNVWATHQLGGSIELERELGTTFTIKFTERKK